MEPGRDSRFHYETAPVLVGLSEFQRVNVKTPSENKVLADMIRNLVRSDRNFGSHHLVQLARVIFSDRSDPLQKLAHEINKLVWPLLKSPIRVHVLCTERSTRRCSGNHFSHNTLQFTEKSNFSLELPFHKF